MRITTTDRPVYYAIEHAGEVVIADVLQPGDYLATGHTVHHSPDEPEYLAAVAGLAGDYNPLPGPGAPLTAGEIYGWGGGLVIVRQSHVRTHHDPPDVPALFAIHRPNAGDVLEWIAGETVTAGMRRTYNSQTYQCLQGHTTQADWTPPQTPALWQEVVEPGPGVPEWAPWTPYATNDVVTYQGPQYRCRQSHTSQPGWTPSAVPALWLLLP